MWGPGCPLQITHLLLCLKLCTDSEAQCCGFGRGGVRDGSDGGHGFGAGPEVITLHFPRALVVAVCDL